MKKTILALFLCFCLLPMTVFADSASDLKAALSEDSDRINMSYTISCMPEGELPEEADEILPWGLVGATVTFDLEYDGTEPDSTRVKFVLTVTEPDGSVGKSAAWVDWNPAAQELLYIMENEGRYLYYDLSADFEVEAAMMESFYLGDCFDASLVTKMLQNWAGNLKFTYKNGVYRAALPEKEGLVAVESMISDLAALFSSMLVGQSDEGAVNVLRGNVAALFTELKDLKLLDEKEAVTAEVTLKDKKTEAMTFTAHVDTDLTKIPSVFGSKVEKEALPVKGTVSLSASYQPANGPIQFPELTKENSSNAMVGEEPVKNEIQPGLNIVVNDVVLAGKNQPYIENDRSMASAQMVCSALGVAYSYDGNQLVVGDGQLVFTKDSATCLINGAVTAMDAAAKELDSELFVPVRLLAETLGYQVNFNQQRAADGSVYASIVLIDEKLAEIPAITVVIPESQTAVAQVLEVAASISGMELNLIPCEDASYVERCCLMLAAGEPVVVLGSAESFGKFSDYVGIVHTLDSYLESRAPKTKALIEANSEIGTLVKNDKGQILAFPVQIGDEVECFYISGTVRNVEGAVSFLHAYSEVLAALIG